MNKVKRILLIEDRFCKTTLIQVIEKKRESQCITRFLEKLPKKAREHMEWSGFSEDPLHSF
jgi:hypothetical protein